MDLRIKKIGNAGDIKGEFIEFSVHSHINLKNYIVSDTFYSHSVKDRKKHTFWFPDFFVNPGTLVRLNTGKGLHNLKLANFYWNLDETLWNESYKSAYLIKIDDYVSFPDNKGFVDSLFSAA